MVRTDEAFVPATFPGPKETRPSLLPKLVIKPWIFTSSPSTILTSCQVVDPTTGKLLDGRQTIVISGGVVTHIGKDTGGLLPEDVLDELDDEVVKVDLKGAFVCPGLVDCHVHVTAVPGVRTMQEMVRIPEQEVNLRSAYVLKEMLQRGFTTVRDTGGASKLLATSLAENLIPGPRLFQCGKALSQTGGHGDFKPSISGGDGESGCCGGHSQSLARVCDGIPGVLKAVREELKCGADFIKIMVGGGVASESDPIDMLQFTEEEIRAITTSCKQMKNKIVTAHAYTSEAVRHAINNGVRAIEHGNLIDRSTAELMAEKGIFLTPTLSCYGIMSRKPFEDFLSEDGKAKNAEVMKKGLEALKVAEEVGVTVCYGTDLLTSMHALQTEEFTVRAEVLDSPTILRQATTNAAKLLNQVGKIGSIEKGAHGDLLILNSNPLKDVTILDRPEDHLLCVIKEGRVYRSSIKDFPVTI